MTGEEAKNYIREWCPYDRQEEIIKALEQEPCEDCISRADVKKYLSAPNENGDRVIYESDLDLLPPVTPQPKTGHWIEDENEMEVRCSECAEENDKCSKYCPNCGVKMESEDKE